MHSVYFEWKGSDETRRQRLYQGQLFAYAPRPAMQRLVAHANAMIAEAFHPLDPQMAQYDLSVEQFVAICAPLKPRFIHHPTTIALLQQVVQEYGCDPETTYLDVPRLRMVTSDGYLTSGVGYAHPPHRDTWYSAPQQQINWWLPLHDIETEMSMAFHPAYFDRAVKNGSGDFNYYEWNAVGRKDAAKYIHTDPRKQPKPEEPVALDPQVRLVLPAGGVVQFAAAHLHSTVANTSGLTRFSIDFRTVHLPDVVARIGAPNVDSAAHGTSLRDFMQVATLERVSEAVAHAYDDVEAPDEAKVFRPELAREPVSARRRR